MNKTNLPIVKIPSSLFKYRGINYYSISGLLLNELYFSLPCEFNDPFEFRYKRINTLNLKDGATDAGRELASLIISDDKSYRCCCFSGDCIKEDNESGKISINDISNQLLWSHYSDGLKGFCIEFNGDIIDQFRSVIKLQGMMYIDGWVTYQNKEAEIPLIDINKCLQTGEHEEYRHKFVFDVINKRFFSKANAWKYEYEYRIVVPNSVSIISYSDNMVKSVVLGEKMPEVNRRLITKICNDKGYKLRSAKLHSKQYKLIVQ